MDKVNKQELRRLALDIASRPCRVECTNVMTIEPAAILSLLDELERLDGDNISLRGSCKALGEQNKLLTRRVKSLSRAVKWLADTGWGVARPKWLTAILAREGGANG